jgi:uroporphyrinogen-III decarboxylase
MQGKERLYSAIKGDPVDRPPIWLREGFNIGGDILKEPKISVLGEGGESEFTLGWKSDDLYRELFDYVSQYADPIIGWDIGEYINRYLMIPPEYIHRQKRKVNENLVEHRGWIDTPTGPLYFIDNEKRNINTYWNIEHPVHNLEELRMIADIPFHFDKENIKQYIDNFKIEHKRLGNRGIMQIDFPSPIVAISHTMKLEDFLAMSFTEKNYFHKLLEEITRRCLIIIDAIFKNDSIETTVNLGGSEQCTPPLMAPNSYDEYIVPYDGQIIKRLKEYDILVNMHCHGKVRHALKCMTDIGVDSTDPVEPPPAGDLEYNEARNIVEQKLTLAGNLEFDELEYAEPDYIKKRVWDILKLGKDRLILGASAGPISPVTPKLVENYKAWIDAVLEYFS